ncbi:MAG: hypothetical protein WAV11_03760 [Minisyncoccia bacterium]
MIIEELENFISDVVNIQELIKRNSSLIIAKSDIKQKVLALSKVWLHNLSTKIRGSNLVDDQVINVIDSEIEKLLEISSANNRKTSYIKILKELPKNIQKTILVPLIRKTNSNQNSLAQAILNKIYAVISDPDEKSYFEEATKVASCQCYRAATVIVWCAVIDRFQKIIEKKGLDEFNKTSKILNAKKSGFYKRFSKEFNVTISNELQEIFDRDLIYVLSAMFNIDINEITAILRLFETRNYAAHPSDYKIDELVYTNFLNEVFKLVISNPKFS